MGVPALFRWLSRKYPKIITPVVEEERTVVNGIEVPPSYANPNPNGELDNLYLDMNGIVHPCSHPEDRPPPETEDDMLLAVFEYTDRVVNMGRPRKILMIAVDGVAPRAKMNQQRSRRFRSARDAKIQDEEREKINAALENYGQKIDDSIKNKKTWDSNAITPGTPFMDKLALAIRYWTAYKLATDPGWANLQVIISDATVPGEGEHKIMNFIRSQRSDIEYDPNTKHAIYGLDADLIFLGLATHEPHFRILREDVFAQDKRSMKLKDQMHMTEEEKALINERESQKPFLWLNINVLREYLELELNIPRLPFKFDLERAIDDWVFMCFFCGNDFLPHLPSLDVRDNSIDLLVKLWKKCLREMNSYITCDGVLNLQNVEILMAQLGPEEDAIFKARKVESDLRKKRGGRRQPWKGENRAPMNQQYLANVTKGKADKGTYTPVNNLPLFDVNNNSVGDLNLTNSDLVQMRTQVNLAAMGDKSAMEALKNKSEGKQEQPAEIKKEVIETANKANANAAAALRKQLLAMKSPLDQPEKEYPSVGDKRKTPYSPAESAGTATETENIPAPGDDLSDKDSVRLHEPGYHDRYYQVKLHTTKDEVPATAREVVKHYIEGISWVLLYYYQGCPSWTWYYPYHYAPFASDFTDIADLEVKFKEGTPFLPYEQLMSVMPAASGHTLPPIFRPLMSDADSPIIDFYPEDFPIDMNGKKMAWQGIVLLPFIDEERLLKHVKALYPKLDDYEKSRNVRKQEVVFMSNKNPNFKKFKALYGENPVKEISFHFSKSGLAGTVFPNSKFEFSDYLKCPIEGDHAFNNVPTDLILKADYEMPPKTKGKSIILTGYIKHKKVLTQEDIDMIMFRGTNGDRHIRMREPPPGPIEVGPGSSSVYTERFGGFKSFLKVTIQNEERVRRQENVRRILQNRSYEDPQGYHASQAYRMSQAYQESQADEELQAYLETEGYQLPPVYQGYGGYPPPRANNSGTLPAPKRGGVLRR